MLKYLGVALISVLMGIGFGLLIAERKQHAQTHQWKTDLDMLEADAEFQERLKHDRLWEIYHTNNALYHDE